MYIFIRQSMYIFEIEYASTIDENGVSQCPP